MFLPANITLKFGDSGDFVSELQRRLAAVKCFNADQVNGFFDGSTVNGVSAFQTMSGLRADGIAGPETLRRLNGVISGDNSSANNHDADQDRLRQEDLARQLQQQEAAAIQKRAEEERLIAEAAQTQHWQQNQAPQQPEIRYAQEAAYTPQQQHPQQAVQAQQQVMTAEAQVQMQHQLAQSRQQDVAVHHVVAQQPAQMQIDPQQQQLAQQQQHQQLAQAAPAHHAQPAQAHVITPQQPAAAVAAAAAAQAALAAGQQVPAPQHAVAAPQALAAAPQSVETAVAPKGIVGRAVQYANDMIQKLSNYFESKLPPNVIDEVKDIGVNMAKSGVKEAAIPMGPEQRAVDAPSRAAQQQPAQQRG